ncbi:MAG TPA: S24 family peptidase [Fimbriimonadaceae bacterium]|nr:hypothetical protein [Armatimonadota bacterium]HCM73595.1 hypothetical protein [Armatimonadota bacterium]HRI73860.1 S24 family peptidase [Fimbriimonadaceae bacterium]
MLLVMPDRRVEEAKQLLAKSRIPLSRLARQLGTTNTTLGHILSGETKNPRDDTLVPRLLTLLREQTSEYLTSPKLPVYYPPQPIRYAGEVPAGTWGDPLASEEFVDADPALWHVQRFVTGVSGVSMYPLLQPGDTLYWHYDRNPMMGVIVLAERSEHRECTVKVLDYDALAMRPSLRPVNPEFADDLDGEPWEVIARLVAVVRSHEGIERRWYSQEGLRERHLS